MPNTERLNLTVEKAALISERGILEQQSPETLIAFKTLALEKLSELEAYVHMVNDVLDGYGLEEPTEVLLSNIEQVALSHGVYDADDGTLGFYEHPEDNNWIIPGEK
jgi:hypothetical protein